MAVQQKEEVLWQPNEGPQTEALEAGEFEILYGGRRGGGKTAGGVGFLLYDREHPLLRSIVIRKNADDLKDWIDRAARIFEPLGATIKGNPPEIHWPSGAVFRTGHLKDENSYMKYQGHEYQRMLIEELTQIPAEDNYLKLLASCRSTIPELRPQVFNTCNPDGPGFYWVKKRWGIAGIPDRSIRTTDPITGLKRIFIPAGLRDNPYLDRDPHYRAFLDGLPDGLRQAWRDGSWDDPIIKGAYYTAELLQARKSGRIKMVPFDPALKVHVIWDLGLDDSMVMLFVQRTSTETRLIHYYQNENFGMNHYAAYLQQRQVERGWVMGKHWVPHDGARREISTGLTVLSTMKKLFGEDRVELIPRIGIADGIQAVRMMFPRIIINEDECPQFLSAVQNYRREWDEVLLKYKDIAVHDWASHGADTLRYLALIEKQITNEDDPHGDWKQPKWEPTSDYEGTREYDEHKGVFDGVDIGSMGSAPQ